MRSVWLIIPIFSTACVTTHRGAQTTTHDGIAISCSSQEVASAPAFGYVHCTFENTSETWRSLEIKSIEAADAIKFSDKKDLADFQNALVFAEQKQKWNEDMLLTGLLLGGTVAALGSGNQSVAAGGAAVALGTIAYGAGRDLSNAHAELQYPTTHLLGGSFRIPPSLFVRRYALFEKTPQTKVAVKSFKICFAPGSKDDCVEVPNG